MFGDYRGRKFRRAVTAGQAERLSNLKKGLEFEVVFIIDLNDKVLPYPVISSDVLPKRKISDSGDLFQDLIDLPIPPT